MDRDVENIEKLIKQQQELYENYKSKFKEYFYSDKVKANEALKEMLKIKENIKNYEEEIKSIKIIRKRFMNKPPF